MSVIGLTLDAKALAATCRTRPELSKPGTTQYREDPIRAGLGRMLGNEHTKRQDELHVQ